MAPLHPAASAHSAHVPTECQHDGDVDARRRQRRVYGGERRAREREGGDVVRCLCEHRRSSVGVGRRWSRERGSEKFYSMISSALHPLTAHTHRTSPRPRSLSLPLPWCFVCACVTVKRVTLFGLSVKSSSHRERKSPWTSLASRASSRRAMAPNNALGNPSAAKLRAAAEGRPSKSPAKRRQSTGSASKSDNLSNATADGFGAGSGGSGDRSVTVQRSHRVAPGQRRERRSKSFRPKRALKGSSWGSYGASGRV